MLHCTPEASISSVFCQTVGLAMVGATLHFVFFSVFFPRRQKTLWNQCFDLSALWSYVYGCTTISLLLTTKDRVGWENGQVSQWHEKEKPKMFFKSIRHQTICHKNPIQGNMTTHISVLDSQQMWLEMKEDHSACQISQKILAADIYYEIIAHFILLVGKVLSQGVVLLRLFVFFKHK